MRKDYDAEDVGLLKSNPRFLVAVDAYRLGFCTLAQMLRLAFTEPPYIPRGLDPFAFSRLVFDLIEQMSRGLVNVNVEDKVKYMSFYTLQDREV